MTSRWYDAAIEIGERIIRQASTEGRHLWWPTLERADGKQFVETRSVSLWGGTGGISLFLAELYRTSRNELYWDSAHRSLDWCICEVENLAPSSRAAFLSGGMGLVYVLCRMAEISGEEHYIDRAVGLTSRLFDMEHRLDRHDLLSGAGGTLLALLYVDRVVQCDAIHHHLDNTLSQLLSGVKPHRIGVFWDISQHWRQPLCGFAHGTSGIAYALLEVLARRESEPLRLLIEDAFRYEDQFFSPDHLNWPDHRRGPDARGPRPNPKYFNAWCHGAAGIGLARLRAVELGVGNQVPLLEAALRRTAADIEASVANPRSWQSFTLCHGLSGLGELELMAGRSSLSYSGEGAEVVGLGALDQLRTLGGIIPGYNPPNQEDCSLFIGSAGIGYFFLRLHDPGATPPVVALRARPANDEWWAPSDDFVTNYLVGGMFPRAKQALGTVAPTTSFNFADSVESGELESSVYRKALWTCVRKAEELPESSACRIKDLISLEASLIDARARVEDFVDLFSHWRVEDGHSRAGANGRANISADEPAVLLPEARIVETRWQWRGRGEVDLEQNLGAPAGAWPVLIVPSGFTSFECWLDEATAWLLSRARESISLAELLRAAPPEYTHSRLTRVFFSAYQNGLLRVASTKVYARDDLV